MFNGAVRRSPELERILQLPRRDINDPQWVAVAKQLTELLKTPEGTQELRVIQAVALHDIGICGGLFGSIEVGGGKTLITLLAPYILNAERPLLILPASLIQKTDRERRKLAEHWLIPDNIKMISYEWLGRDQAKAELDDYKPDVIICDEVHKLKNKHAAVTRRVGRYMKGK